MTGYADTPWRIEDRSVGTRHEYIVRDANSHQVAVVFHRQDGVTPRHARLFVNAPTLLSLLKQAQRIFATEAAKGTEGGWVEMAKLYENAIRQIEEPAVRADAAVQ